MISKIGTLASVVSAICTIVNFISRKDRNDNIQQTSNEYRS